MMVRWEVFKLLRQRRTFLGLGSTALVPLVFLAAVEIIGSGPEAGEAPFAAQLLGNGLVIPFVTLAFGSVVLLPLLTVLVAGDAVAGEVSGGTLKTILGRSVGRSGLFWSKAAAVGLYTLAVVGAFVGVGLAAGWLAIGFRPLAGLGGGADPGRSSARPNRARSRPRGAAPAGPRRLRPPALRRNPEQRRLRGRRPGAHPASATRPLLGPWRRLGPLPPDQPVLRLAEPHARAHRLGPDHRVRMGQRRLGRRLLTGRMGSLRPLGRIELARRLFYELPDLTGTTRQTRAGHVSAPVLVLAPRAAEGGCPKDGSSARVHRTLAHPSPETRTAVSLPYSLSGIMRSSRGCDALGLLLHEVHF
jgi:hypothetical protein